MAVVKRLMRILGLDVGSKTIGIAMSDPLGMTAQPVTVLRRTTETQDVDAIAALVKTHDVACIVVGHPLSLKGTPTPQTRRVEALAHTLERLLPCAVRLWDERLTTAQGERVLLEGGVRRKQRRHIVNQTAAQLILHSYLESQRACDTPTH